MGIMASFWFSSRLSATFLPVGSGHAESLRLDSYPSSARNALAKVSCVAESATS